MDAPRTKAMIQILQDLQLDGAKTLIVLNDKNENITRSANNLPQVKTLLASYLNVIDLLKYDIVVMPQAALAHVESWLGERRAGTEVESAA
jgi:large subunit ribosomal protein L4